MWVPPNKLKLLIFVAKLRGFQFISIGDWWRCLFWCVDWHCYFFVLRLKTIQKLTMCFGMVWKETDWTKKLSFISLTNLKYKSNLHFLFCLESCESCTTFGTLIEVEVFPNGGNNTGEKGEKIGVIRTNDDQDLNQLKLAAWERLFANTPLPSASSLRLFE